MDETMMSSAQWFEAKGHKVGLKEGREEGLKEGREEGELAGQRKTLLGLLGKKFPNQSGPQISLKLENINDLDRLSALTDRIFEDMGWEQYWAE